MLLLSLIFLFLIESLVSNTLIPIAGIKIPFGFNL